jgi:hypothetical protein
MSTHFEMWSGEELHAPWICRHEVLEVLCNILIVHSVSVNVDQLMGMFDNHHKTRLQKVGYIK